PSHTARADARGRYRNSAALLLGRGAARAHATPHIRDDRRARHPRHVARGTCGPGREVRASMSQKTAERRQVVRFAFYKLDSAWRRLSAERQASSKIEFGELIESFAGRLLLRPYGLVGIRGDCDFLLWQVAENLDALVALQTALNRTDLGAYLTSP